MGYTYFESDRQFTTQELINKLEWTSADFCHQAAERLKKVYKLEREINESKAEIERLKNQLQLKIRAAPIKRKNMKAIRAERQKRGDSFLDFTVKHFNLDKDKLISLNRTDKYKNVRHIYSYAALRVIPNMTYFDVGMVLNRHHATIMNGEKRVIVSEKLTKLANRLISKYQNHLKRRGVI